MRISCIYIIKSPFTNKPKYIGQTMDFKSRVSQHLSQSKNPYCLISKWIALTIKSGGEPIFEIYKHLPNEASSQ